MFDTKQVNKVPGSRKPTVYLPPTNIKIGDLVWLKWKNRNFVRDQPIQAKPSVVTKVYDDGNILHRQDNFDETQFAFANTIVAKSPSSFTRVMRYRMVPLEEVVSELVKRA